MCACSMASIQASRARSPAARRACGSAIAMRLEQLAHAGAASPVRRVERAVDLGGLARAARRLRAPRRASRCRAGAGTRPASIGPCTRAPMLSAACASAWKSTWAVRSTSPGVASGSAKAWPPTACKVSPMRALGVAVVDDQRGAAVRARRGGRARARSGRRAIRRSRRSARRACSRGSNLVEQRDRIAGDAERELAVRRRSRPRARASRRRSSPPGAPAARRRTRWRGRSAGPSGTSSSVAMPQHRHVDCGQAPAAAAARSAGLISTRCTTIAARKSGTTCAARSASSIMVPRPGPSSTSRTFSGAPICCQAAAAHSPISSPNIWLTSGAVMKSPARAERIARDVVAVLRMA